MTAPDLIVAFFRAARPLSTAFTASCWRRRSRASCLVCANYGIAATALLHENQKRSVACGGVSRHATRSRFAK